MDARLDTQVTIRTTQELADKLRKEANRRISSRSRTITQILNEYFKEQELKEQSSK